MKVLKVITFPFRYVINMIAEARYWNRLADACEHDLCLKCGRHVPDSKFYCEDCR